jgi:heme/copper-type cytochrome/quinol oxidase subunit 2
VAGPGTGHALMFADLLVLSPDNFRSWYNGG